jgi:hypothetical protein
MRSTPIGRRELLQKAAVFIGASSVAASALAATKATTGKAKAATQAACAASDGPDASLRKSLNYVETGPNPAQQCAGCGFFSEPKDACGKCQIFNGPANQHGHCDSWSARS